MNKNRIRLTESQLHRIIEESVKKVLKEKNDPNFEGVRGFGKAFKDGYNSDSNFYNRRDDSEIRHDRSTGLDAFQHKGKRLLGKMGNKLGRCARHLHTPKGKNHSKNTDDEVFKI